MASEALLKAEHLDALQARLGEREAAGIDVEDVHVGLGLIILGEREQLRLMIVDEQLELQRVLVDLLEREVAMPAVVALAVAQVGESALDRLAQEGDDADVERDQFGSDEWKVAGDDAQRRHPLRR